MTLLCQSCNDPLNVAGDPTSLDCGGDCRRCMANAGDPDCLKSMEGLTFPYKALSDFLRDRHGLPAVGTKVTMRHAKGWFRPRPATVHEVAWFPSLWLTRGATQPGATVTYLPEDIMPDEGEMTSRVFYSDEWHKDAAGNWTVTVV